MTRSRIGGAAAVVGGAAWLIIFGAAALDTRSALLDGLVWILPLTFGLGAIGLYDRASRRQQRWAIPAAGAVAVLAAAALLAGTVLVGDDSTIAYLMWLVFIAGIVALLALVLAYGLSHRGDPVDRRVARTALVVAGVPFAFLVLILAYKLVTGWWVTDRGLVAFGSIGGALLVGGGWLVLGFAIWMRGPSRSGRG